METKGFIYRKQQLLRFLLGCFLLLSFFYSSGPIGLSSFPLQRFPTELRCAEQQATFSRHTCNYFHLSRLNTDSGALIGRQFEHSARLIYADLLKVKLNHLRKEFRQLKSGMRYQERLTEFIYHQNTPSFGLIPCLFQAYSMS